MFVSRQFEGEVWIVSLGGSGGRSSPRSSLLAVHGFGGRGIIGADLAKDNFVKFFAILDLTES